MQKLYMPKFVTVDKRELKSALRLTLGKRFIEPTAKEMNTKKRNVQGWLSTTKAVPEALLELIRRKLPETEERMPGRKEYARKRAMAKLERGLEYYEGRLDRAKALVATDGKIKPGKE